MTAMYMSFNGRTCDFQSHNAGSIPVMYPNCGSSLTLKHRSPKPKDRGSNPLTYARFETIGDVIRYVSQFTSCRVSTTLLHIVEVCNGKRKTAFGYRWEFANKLIDMPA